MQKLVYIVKPSSDLSLWHHILNLVPKINSEFEIVVILIRPEFLKIDLSQKLPFKMTIVRDDQNNPRMAESSVKTILGTEKPRLVHTIGNIDLGLKNYLATHFKERWVHTVYTTEDKPTPLWRRLLGKKGATQAWSVFLTEAERRLQKKVIQRKSSVIAPVIGDDLRRGGVSLPVVEISENTGRGNPAPTILVLAAVRGDSLTGAINALRVLALLRLALGKMSIKIVLPSDNHPQIVVLVEDLKLTGLVTLILPQDFSLVLSQSRLVIKLAPEPIFDDRLASAMQAGIPVILSSVDYFCTVTAGHKGVFAFKPSEQYLLSQTIKELFTKNDFYNQSSIAAAETAGQIFSHEKISQDHITLYKMLS